MVVFWEACAVWEGLVVVLVKWLSGVVVVDERKWGLDVWGRCLGFGGMDMLGLFCDGEKD